MPQTASPQVTDIIRPVVLVVDDDPGVLEALGLLLTPRLEPIYRVETAGSAEKALEWVAANSPELMPLAAVISDEKMPGMQGTDLLVALRQAPAHRFGGRIIITGYAGLESAKKAINEAEVARYYPKPWDDEKQLLPALAEILTEFASKRGLDEYLVAAATALEPTRIAIETIRRAWWEYLTLMGMSAADAEVDEPDFFEPIDATSTHLLVSRVSPLGSTPAAAVRLAPVGPEGTSDLAALAFMPGEANEGTETLLLCAALLEARARGAARVRTEVPVLRREIYELLGFAPFGEPTEPVPSITMVAPTTSGAPLDGPDRAFALRHERERRLCRCAQEGCPAKDYAAERRGYFCPLDLMEGRVPKGFPAAGRV